MARKKSTDAIEAEITKVKSNMSRLQDRYDRLAEKLKSLQEKNAGLRQTPLWRLTSKAAKALTKF